MMVTPHLKTVLKDYQHSAVKSLHGPAHHLHPPLRGAATAVVAAVARAPNEESTACSPAAPTSAAAAYAPPLAVQQLPILTAPDTSSSDLSFTPLEDVSISCFTVGGEKRLCLPQVLQSVLGDFTLAQINHQCDNLLIYCSRCTPEQLNVLKSQGILPSSAFSCGLITKSDAERLCSALLYAPSTPRGKPTAARTKKDPTSLPQYAESNVEAHKAATAASIKTEDGDPERPPVANGTRAKPHGDGRVFRVRHECFGHAVGMLHEALYVAKQAKCIECVECKGWHSPQQFVKHVHWQHARGESQTVHWGFDSAKWRHYLLPLLADTADDVEADGCCAELLDDEEDADDAHRVLDLMRDQYEGVTPFAAYDEQEKSKSKKDVKEWSMSHKHKLLHQLSKSLTPPPQPPPTPPTIKRDTSSPLFTTKKSKLSSEEYSMLMPPSFLQPMDSYLPSAVFQQFSLPFAYAALPPHALPLGIGHPSAKEAKVRQTIVESNADLVLRPAAAAPTLRLVEDAPLPPTPKKQRLFRHMQEQQQRRKLEEVQKSPDSTTVPTTTPSASIDHKFSEIDLSTTDTDDTASEGTASAHSNLPKPTSAVPDEPVADSELECLHALFEAHPHPERRRITDMFRRLIDECASRADRIRDLETHVAALRRRQARTPTDATDTDGGGVESPEQPIAAAEPAIADSADDQVSKQVQIDYKSVITSSAGAPAEGDVLLQSRDDGDGPTTTTFDSDAKPSHCPSGSVPLAT